LTGRAISLRPSLSSQGPLLRSKLREDAIAACPADRVPRPCDHGALEEVECGDGLFERDPVVVGPGAGAPGADRERRRVSVLGGGVEDLTAGRGRTLVSSEVNVTVSLLPGATAKASTRIRLGASQRIRKICRR
jgi:hypothetical protein